MSVVGPGIDVFLCHNSADKDAIRAVNEVLRQQFDLSTFLDESKMVGGDKWEAVIRQALGASRTLAVFLGANGWGHYQLTGEVLPAIARRRRDAAFRIVPVLLHGASEDEMMRVPEVFGATHWVSLRGGAADEFAIRILVGAIRGENVLAEGQPVLTPARLRFDAARWNIGGRGDTGVLYRGNDLLRAGELAQARQGDLTPLAVEFLQASRRHEAVVNATQLAGHAHALVNDPLYASLAFRLANAALDVIDSPLAHEVLRHAVAMDAPSLTSVTHRATITALFVDATNDTAITGDEEGCCHVWHLTTGEVTATHSAPGPVGILAYEPTSGWIASTHDNEVHAWSQASPTAAAQAEFDRPVTRIGWTAGDAPDLFVATGIAGQPGELAVIASGTWADWWRQSGVTDAAPLPGTAHLALAQENKVLVVSPSDRRVIATLELTATVTALTAHPSSATLAATTLDGCTYVMEFSADPPEFKGYAIDRGTMKVAPSRFSPDGSKLIVLGDNQTVRLYRLSDDVLLLTLPYGGLFGFDAQMDPSQHVLALVVNDPLVQQVGMALWDLRTGTRLLVPTGEATLIGFDKAGRFVFAGDSPTASVKRLPRGREPDWERGGYLALHLAFSKDGRWLVVVGQPVAENLMVKVGDVRCAVLDSATGAVIAEVDVNATVHAVTVGAGVSLRLDDGWHDYMIEDDRLAETGHRPVDAVEEPRAFDPREEPAFAKVIETRGLVGSHANELGSAVLLTHERHLVSLWTREDETWREEVKLTTRAEVSTVVFGSTGVVAIGDNHGTVTLLRLNGAKVAEFGRGEPVKCLCFASGDHTLAVAALDTALRVWPISTSALRARIDTSTLIPLTEDERTAYTSD